MDIAVLAQVLSSLATFVVAAGILYQGREARRARDDQDRPQIIVDADYTGRFTTNIVVRNIGHGTAKNITFEFLGAPSEHERARYHRAALLSAWYKLHGSADVATRRVGLLPERGPEPEVEGFDRGHHDHLLLRGPTGGAVRDRVDDQSSAARGQWLLGLQGLRGRGAGPRGPGAGLGEDLPRHRRSQRNDEPPSRWAGGVDSLRQALNEHARRH